MRTKFDEGNGRTGKTRCAILCAKEHVTKLLNQNAEGGAARIL